MVVEATRSATVVPWIPNGPFEPPTAWAAGSGPLA